MTQSTESTKNVCLSKQNVSEILAFQLPLYFTKDKKQQKQNLQSPQQVTQL